MNLSTRSAPFLAVMIACGGGGGGEGGEGGDGAGSTAELGVAVEILEPMDGAELSGPDVRVLLGAQNVEIVAAGIQQPNSAHHHLYVDADLTPRTDPIPAGPGIIHLGAGQSEHVIEGLSPGEHVIIARMGDWQHVPLDDARTDTVRITISAPN